MMAAMTLRELALVTGAETPAENRDIVAVSTDTRNLVADSAFVALRGERFDGHAFVEQARDKGATAAIVEEHVPVEIAQIQVRDSQKALGDIAALNRKRFAENGGQVIALTGSSGKTSCKEMLAAILRQDYAVLATQGNLNNEIGVPLTLLDIATEHQIAVVEMGAAKRGDIAYLCDFARPDIALITNAGPAHLEGFGSLETVAETKGEIYQSLGESGTAIINADDVYAPLWRSYTVAKRVVNVSLQSEKAEVYARNLQSSVAGTRFELCAPEGVIEISLPVLGQAMVMNALMAAAASMVAGVGLKSVASGLAQLKPVPGRLFPRPQAWGTVIDDSYNANPASVKAAIDVLANFDGRRLLILGTMAELGTESEALHREVGEYAKHRGIDRVLTCGAFADATAGGAGDGAKAFENREALIEALHTIIQDGDTVLVKGSRSAGMDDVVEALASVQASGGASSC